VEARLPSGTLTFLFTDVEGSTRTLTEVGLERYAEALEEHNRLIRDAVAAHGGIEVDTQGDAFFCVFTSARDAVACARDAQQALAATRIRVRMGVHSGEALAVDDHYVGLDVHRAARVAGAAHGGQVLLSPATVPLLEPGSFELLDLGEHRLKDLSAPLRLHQLGGETFPALKTLHRTNLPLPATPFLGRRREVEALRGRSERLLTLTGPGGTGKTRLALQVAAQLADEFPGGVLWVPLASLRDAAVVPTAIADVFDAEDVETAAATLADDTLLVVDNCEHVLDEAGRAVAALLRETERLRVIATSREPLAVAGEHVVPVDPLERNDAVELFVARAEAAGATALDAAAVTELCARLDDLPLAIELAAARTPALPPALLLERLAGRLDLLRGARDADDRQRTLAATIGWSYDLLNEDEQRSFRNLSLFVGGAVLDAVEDVAQAELDALASLVAKSLVRVLST
jgi:class 3 adenylate cyclase